MLILSRTMRDSEVVIDTSDGEVVVTVMELTGGKVRLGFTAPRAVAVNRREIHERIKRGEPWK